MHISHHYDSNVSPPTHCSSLNDCSEFLVSQLGLLTGKKTVGFSGEILSVRLNGFDLSFSLRKTVT